jgi:protocatechuate 3,4-dioxygenase beta subunit
VNGTVNVTAGTLNITVGDVSGKYKETVELNASVLRDTTPVEGLEIEFYINGEYVGNGTTDSNGVARFNYTIVSAGSFTYYAYFAGNVYLSEEYSDSVVVVFDKLDTVISVENVTGKVGESITLVGRIVDENNNGVANVVADFYVNGTYVGSNVTNAEGMAILLYSFAVDGNFNYSAVFAGDGNYSASVSANGSINVTEGKLNITVGDVSGKYNETVELNASVLDESSLVVVGVEVGFYINGLYVGNGTTDSEGVARFNYRIASAGSFTYYAYFVGNSTVGPEYSETIVVVFNKLDTVITVENVTGSLGKSTNLIAEVVDENGVAVAGMVVEFYVDGVNVGNVTTGADGIATFDYDLTAVGEFNYNAVVIANGNYTSSVSVNGTVNVTAALVNITVEDVVGNYSQNVVFNATVKSNVTGVGVAGILVDFYLTGSDGSEVYVGSNTTNADGTAIFEYRIANAGTFNLTAKWRGSEDYAPANATVEVMFNKINATIDVEDIVGVKYNDTAGLNASVTDQFGEPAVNATVDFYVNGVYVGSNTTGSDGNAVWNYDVPSADDFNYSANIASNNTNFNANSSANKTISVEKLENNLTVSNVSGLYGDTINLTAKLTDERGRPVAGKDVTFYYNNGTIIGTAQTGSDGIARLSYIINKTSELGSGTLSYYVNWTGDGNYSGFNSSEALNGTGRMDFNKGVLTIVVQDVTGVKYNDVVQLNVTVVDQAGNKVEGAMVYFYILDGRVGSFVDFNTTDADGVASIYYKFDRVGRFEFYASFIGDERYNATNSNKINITIGRADSNITVEDVDGAKGNNLTLTANMTDKDGNPLVNKTVDFYVNGTYVGTNQTGDNGIANFTYLPPHAGDGLEYYGVFKGDGNYTAFNSSHVGQSGVVDIAKGNVTVSIGDVVGEFNEEIPLEALVVDQNGNLVSGVVVDFYVNGDYVGSAKTDNGGEAVFNYTPNATGNFTYSAGISASDDYNGNISAGSHKVEVRPATTAIVVEDVVAQRDNHPFVSATLTDPSGRAIAGKEVDFYYSNGTYMGTATTNKNGIATLVTTITTSGEYRYHAVFDGDNNYTSKTSSSGSLDVVDYLSHISVDNAVGYHTGVVNLSATLVDDLGRPMADRIIDFYVNNVYVGSAKTNENGIAIFHYKANSSGNFTIKASFAGDTQSTPVTGYGKLESKPYAELEIHSTASKKVLKVGETFNLLTTVTNLGPDESSFVLTVEIPEGMEFVSAKASKGAVTYRDGVVYWKVSNLDPKYSDVLLNPAGDLAPYQALLNITLKVLKPGEFTFKYNAEGINTVVDVRGDIKVDVVTVKNNGTDHNKTEYNHGYSGMMKTGIPVPKPIPVPTDSPVLIAIIIIIPIIFLIPIIVLIAIFFIVIGLRRRKRDQ